MLNFRCLLDIQMEMLEGQRVGKDVLGMCIYMDGGLSHGGG